MINFQAAYLRNKRQPEKSFSVVLNGFLLNEQIDFQAADGKQNPHLAQQTLYPFQAATPAQTMK